MVAEIKYNPVTERFSCSNCLLTTHQLVSQCPFCDSLFSNYEEMQLEFWYAKQLKEIQSENI